jgi:hypothetical protein
MLAFLFGNRTEQGESHRFALRRQTGIQKGEQSSSSIEVKKEIGKQRCIILVVQGVYKVTCSLSLEPPLRVVRAEFPL